MQSKSVATIIIPCGPGADAALDTAESVTHYCLEPHDIVFVDDCTSDGTYEKIIAKKQHNWHVLRNPRRHGYIRLVQTLCLGFRYIHAILAGRCVLKLDTDALIIHHGVITEALKYMDEDPKVGLFGVYDVDYNRHRSFSVHVKQINRETAWWHSALGIKPSWTRLLQLAENKGYRRGENVFGGAYFITRSCLAAMQWIGALDVPYRWHSHLAEDVYFSMATKAAGYNLGHFAAPKGPLCLEFQGLPYPACEMWRRGYKIVHSVDKGPNTSAPENEGQTAREFFKDMRKKQVSVG